MTPEPGTEVRVVFSGTTEPVYRAGGHPDGHLLSLVPVRLAGGQIVFVPLVGDIEITEAGGPRACGGPV